MLSRSAGAHARLGVDLSQRDNPIGDEAACASGHFRVLKVEAGSLATNDSSMAMRPLLCSWTPASREGERCERPGLTQPRTDGRSWTRTRDLLLIREAL